jgi:hypothetical protein
MNRLKIAFLKKLRFENTENCFFKSQEISAFYKTQNFKGYPLILPKT